MSDQLKNAYRIWHVVSFGADPDGAEYAAVCTKDIPETHRRETEEAILEEIYTAHQNLIGARNPAKTRSLSMGDVVQLFDVNGVSRYRRVEGIGFVRVRRVNDTFEEIK